MRRASPEQAQSVSEPVNTFNGMIDICGCNHLSYAHLNANIVASEPRTKLNST